MDFLSFSEITVTKIVLAICVEKGAPIHRNRPSHGLALQLGGRREYVFEDGKNFTIEKNGLIYLPKGSSYTVRTHETGKTYAINFEIDREERFSPFYMRIKDPFLLTEAFVAAERAWGQSNAGRESELRARLYDVLAHLQRERERIETRDPRWKLVQRAEQYLSEHYTDPELRVCEMAAVCGVSEVYLRRLYRELLETTPVTRLRAHRMKRAKELIASGFYGMREAAELSGYAEYSYFCREFKRETGYAPSEYRD